MSATPFMPQLVRCASTIWNSSCDDSSDCVESPPANSVTFSITGAIYTLPHDVSSNMKNKPHNWLPVFGSHKLRFGKLPFGQVGRLAALLVLVVLSSSVLMPVAGETISTDMTIIGAVAEVGAVGHDLDFVARVDTGATTCSLHVEKWEIAGELPEMADNVGKTIRFLLANRDGDTEWVERKIAQLSIVKTSEREEARYKVSMDLACCNVKKRVLVSLNDRSHMKYAMLLGRNFLDGDFLVDVSQENLRP